MSWKNNQRIDQTMNVIAHLLTQEGHDAAAFFGELGVDINAPQQSERARDKALEIEVLEKALAILPAKAGYGLHVGKLLPVAVFGVWGLAIVTSPNVRSALETLIRYSETSLLLSQVSLRENEQQAHFVVKMDHLPASIHRFLFERFLSVTIGFFREVVPGYDVSGLQLHLPFVDPSYQQELAQQTQLNVVAGASNYAVVADHTFLDVPLPDTDPVLHAQFIAQCDEVLNEHHELSGYAQTIREYILRSDNFSPNLADVAASLFISERTLRRRLAKDNVSYHQIVLETKMTLAKELLLESSMPIKVVADRLDYAETASFARAFKKWWGVPPAQIGRLHLNN